MNLSIYSQILIASQETEMNHYFILLTKKHIAKLFLIVRFLQIDMSPYFYYTFSQLVQFLCLKHIV